MKKFALLVSMAAMSAAVTAAPAEKTVKKPEEVKVKASSKTANKDKAAKTKGAAAAPMDASGVDAASGVVK